MHNSKKIENIEKSSDTGKKAKSRVPGILKVVACIILFSIIVKAMDIALYPCTFMRNDVHAVTAKQNDVIIMGTSHGKMDLVPDAILEGTGQTGHNICVGGEYPIDAYYLTKLILEKQNPQEIIYEVDPGYFAMEKEVGNNFLLFYHEFPFSLAKAEYFADTLMDTDFRNSLFQFYEYPLSYELSRVSDTVTKKLGQDYDVSSLKSATQEYHENGFIERYAVDTTTMAEDIPKLFTMETLQESNMEYLSKLIKLCRDNNIKFTAVTTPIPAVTLMKYQDNYSQAWSYFSDYFESEGVDYYNFNVEYYNAYSHDLSHYTDYDGHMNGNSAIDFSRVLGQKIH